MGNKVLDLSALSDVDYELVKKGYDDFINGDKTKFGYFGYVDRRTLKILNQCAKRGKIIWPLIGGLIVLGMTAGIHHLWVQWKKDHKKEVQEFEEFESV